MAHNAERIYCQQRAQGWTRVDMLVALYDAGIGSIEAALEAAAAGDDVLAHKHRMKAIRVVHGIAAGLDIEQGEVPLLVARLCENVHHGLTAGTTNEVTAARQVLSTLREAYVEIRDEAAELERTGKIPQLEFQSRLQVTV